MTIQEIKNIPLIVLLLAVFACTRPSETEFPVVEPATAGLLSDSLALIDSHIQWAIDSQFISGGVMLVARDNKIVFQKAIGFADREKTKPLTTDHIFRMASMTKPIVSVAIMQLVEKGKLKLDDPVSNYIPEFKNSVVVENFKKEDSSYTTRPAAREITIHHLLTHTSGLAYSGFYRIAGAVYPPFEVNEAWTKDSVYLKSNVPKMGKLPLLHDPGSKYTYGISIDVLGYVIEVVSGIPLDQYLQENIFSPLTMTDTYFYLPEEKSNRLVDVWYANNIDPNAFPEVNRDDYPIHGFKTYFSGGSGLNSTGMDYLKFSSALLNGGQGNGNRILKQESINQMMTNQIDTLFIGEGEQFGYGGAVYTSDAAFGRKPGRYSWDGYWQTRFWVDPQRRIIGIILTNTFGSAKDRMVDRYEEIINNAIVEK